ncbi:MAG: hypothetical protein RMJ67_06035 [Elusimicrobiota bacterium]|nr:hypothetical protein [Endomicrobiia bacterium]MDW8166052.1 hypothetical protein [Elusimicrobiota bacterium]
MGLIKKHKSINFSIGQVSSNSEGRIYTATNITNILHREDYLKLYRGTYYLDTINLNNITIQSESRDSKLIMTDLIYISGNTKFINLNIEAKRIVLLSGATLQLINCYVKKVAENQNDFCIDAKVGKLEIENSTIDIIESGNLKAPIILGYNAKISNSSINSYKFSSTQGTLILDKSRLSGCKLDTSVILDNYFIRSNNSFINIGTYGLFDIDAQFSEIVMSTLPEGDYPYGLSGLISNSKINRLFFYNLREGRLIVRNSEIIAREPYYAVMFYNSSIPCSFENCVIKSLANNSSLFLFFDSNCIVYLINCYMYTKNYRYVGNDNLMLPFIRTYNCICNSSNDLGIPLDAINDNNILIDSTIENFE